MKQTTTIMKKTLIHTFVLALLAGGHLQANEASQPLPDRQASATGFSEFAGTTFETGYGYRRSSYGYPYGRGRGYGRGGGYGYRGRGCY